VPINIAEIANASVTTPSVPNKSIQTHFGLDETNLTNSLGFDFVAFSVVKTVFLDFKV
jgi:hypothetical protein